LRSMLLLVLGVVLQPRTSASFDDRHALEGRRGGDRARGFEPTPGQRRVRMGWGYHHPPSTDPAFRLGRTPRGNITKAPLPPAVRHGW